MLHIFSYLDILMRAPKGPVPLRYRIFQNGNYSEWIYFDFEISESEKVIYQHTIERGGSLNMVPGLKDALQRAREVIEPEEIMCGITNEDEHVLQCLGLVEVDPAYLNELIAERNQETLEFFGLEDASEEELNAWNANDLTELPLVCELGVDFREENPFSGWWLQIEFVEP